MLSETVLHIFVKLLFLRSHATCTDFLQLLNACDECIFTAFYYYPVDNITDSVSNFLHSQEIDNFHNRVNIEFSRNIVSRKLLNANLARKDYSHHVSNYNKRLSHCSIHLFPSSNTKVILETRNNNEPYPNYVWILYMGTTDIISRGPKIQWIHFMQPVIFLEIYNFTQYNFMCFPCLSVSSHLLVVEYVRSVINLQKLHRIWHKIHEDLRGIHINNEHHYGLTEKKLAEYIDSNNVVCKVSAFSKSLISPHFCSVILISKKLNFTLVKNLNVKRFDNGTKHSTILYNTVISKQDLEVFRSTGYEWMPFGVHTEPFAFSVIYNKNSKFANRNSILSPFSWSIWFGVGAASLFTAFVISYTVLQSSNKKPKLSLRLKLNHVSRFWLHLNTLLIDQSTRFGIVSLTISRSNVKVLVAITLWFSWTFVCMQISQHYKGLIFSSLSVPRKPILPETVEDLLHSKLLIGTTANVLIRVRNTTFSQLRDIMLADILANDPGQTSVKTLQKSLAWFTDSVQQFVFNALKSGTVLIQGSKFAEKLPNEFAIMDPLTQINLFTTLFQFLGEKLISKPRHVSVFTNRDFWTVPGNYLYHFISNAVAQIYETGLFQRWDKHFIYKRQINRIQEIFQLMFPNPSENDLSRKNGVLGIPVNKLKSYLTALDFGLENGKYEEFESVPKNVYRNILHYWIVCLIAATGALLCEIILYRIRKLFSNSVTASCHQGKNSI